MQDGRHRPGNGCNGALCARRPDHHSAPRGRPSDPDRDGSAPRVTRQRCITGVEYLVRAARITDIERLVTLGAAVLDTPGSGHPLNAADLLRQLVYLPQASVFVAEVRREVVGGSVLVLRPSVVAGGYVGTVDLLVVDPAHDADRVSEALLEEALRSASNKGCTVVEAAQPREAADLARWERLGFRPTGPLLRRSVAAVGAAARRT